MTSSNSETALIADQLRRAFEGEAWHGPAVLEILKDVDAANAAAKPLADVHSIWELVLHIEVWDWATLERLADKETQPTGTKNFPPVAEATESAWAEAVRRMTETHTRLVETVAGLPDARLRDRVPGKDYDFYHLLHGVVQHELYHAGQMVILKKILA
jgi:uncharacterized damage-inducible protein DinB